jgi:FtsP/CotA-like multicopper oxidase with cupredoxin domain
MKKLLCFALLFVLGSLAFGQVNIPPCDPNNPPPNCTDYFGSGNWANSPVPAGGITGFTVVAQGSGYANPVVVINDATGTGATAGAVTLTAGAVTAVAAGSAGSGYIAPQVTIVDVGTGGTLAAPTCGPAPMPACGSGALVTAVLGGALTGGMPKFVATDLLPDLKSLIAASDTTTFPGSDFYVIGLKQYSQVMHSSLPATTLRGYCQLTPPSYTTCAAGQPSYLGPVILAQKNRPVRVLFVNMLPTGAGGNLFIPTDTTYMGAGMNNNNASSYTQNRATLHLHGGATPWISDGTPHQWTVPVGEVTPNQKGDSTQNVPDMWFDASGNLINACAGNTTCGATGATTDPGQGKMTFYWTNQQGGRLMFYHDHAYGITRLNVYAGEAAGYLLYDPVEESTLLSAGVPGTLAVGGAQTAPDVAHLIPLVIQDKTFVPSQPQLMVQDPTWAGNFGATPLSQTNSNGDLWFPHVYMPNQNPADATTANAFGRWDYGAWFFPPMTQLSAATPQSATTVPCTSAAFPNQVVQCPITPNPSGTPEGFLDTPVLNGKAYPVLHVAPATYRFQILSAGNDRSWNLSWFVADATGKDVAMIQAAPPPTNGLPLCSSINPVAVPPLVIGLATAIVDGNGNPINGTGLQAGCWPNYGPQQGIPTPQTMWSAEGAAGGAPDPRNAGPAWIQIGTEGGLLPAPVVIPATPINYELNTRSITITSVGVHGLWLGPAERADVIVDFSQFAGKTLILYNDAPAPAPAIDVRLDYYTGDGDQTPVGGAPNTQPGYGPNTRTLMQVVVDANAPNTVPFSMPALQANLPGLFAQTQPPIIVPEPTYPPASGGYSAIQSYSGIQDYTLTYYPLGSTTPVTNTNERKAIQELFTTDYGRMNATLGTELPLVNFTTQTTIPLAYIDPPTEIINPGAVQLWKVTHNGVDSHFIHFHLFNVQVINRVGWDGSMRPPDANELGWKDTVRMNPLEDILVGLQPIQPVLPWPLRDSYRLMDVTQIPGSDCAVAPPGAPADAGTCSPFTNLNPYTNNPAQTPNAINDFGWEYVWHCHILGHEENDMMRAMSFVVPPEAPSNLGATAAGTGYTLTWTDMSASETGFTLQRATDAAFATAVNIGPIGVLSPDANGQGITFGGTVTYNDTAATTPPYWYRVQAFKPDANYWTPGNVTSTWSNVASVGGGALASVSPTTLAFGNVALNVTSPAQTVTLSNTGSATLTGIIITPSAEYAVSATTCGATLAGNSSCTISVTFTPTVSGPQPGTLTIASNLPTLTVSLTGNGGLPLLTITAGNATKRYGAAVPAITPSYSGFLGTDNPANSLTAQPTCTTTATAASAVGTYPTSCVGAASATYTIVYVSGAISVTQASLTIWAPTPSYVVGSAIPASFAPSYVGFVNGDTAANAFLTPNSPPSCTSAATSTSPIGTYPITCTGAVNPNYAISYVNGRVTITKGVLTITAPSPSMLYGGPMPTLTPSYNPASPVGPFTPATCTTTATVTSPVGTYPVTCSGAVDANYNISYVAGTLTINLRPLTITANSRSKTYGQTVTFAGTEFTASGLQNGQTIGSVTLTSTGAPAAAAVGSYSIVPSAATGGTFTPSNYTISYVNGTLTVSRAALTIRANNDSKTYGQVKNYGPGFTAFTSTGLQNGQTIGSVTLASTGAPATAAVGNYSIVPSAATGGTFTPGNYTITYVNGTLTVSKASTTTTITRQSPNPSAVHQSVAVTFTVTPQFGQTPTGNVTVTASTGESCTASVAAGTCNITFNTTGTRLLVASYPGNTNFTASASAKFSQTVN